jgi:hypothetical protein
MSDADPTPAASDSKTTSKPASFSLDSLKAMAGGVKPDVAPKTEGPDVLPTNPPTDTTPPPGDNSAPPPIHGIPPPKKEISPQEMFMSFLFILFSAVGIYFGITLGMSEGHGYLLFIQSFGPWIRSWFTSRHALSSVYDVKK